MGKLENLVDQSRSHWEPGEQAVAAILGAYDTIILGSRSVRNGVMVATDRRVIFYAKKLGGYDLESFPYENISSFEQSKSMSGHQLSFFAVGNRVTLKWITDLPNFERFTHAFKARIRPYSTPAPQPFVATQPVAQSDTDTILAQLSQLGQLRDAGVLSQQEFENKKSVLLSRLI